MKQIILRCSLTSNLIRLEIKNRTTISSSCYRNDVAAIGKIGKLVGDIFGIF